MGKTTLRLFVLSLLFSTLILPLYLILRTNIYEFIWLYVPVGVFWVIAYFEQLESNQGGSE